MAANAGSKANAERKAAATKAGPKARAKRKAAATEAGLKAKAKCKAAATKAGVKAKRKEAATMQAAAQKAEVDGEPWDEFFGELGFLIWIFRPQNKEYSLRLFSLMKELFFANLEVKQLVNPRAAMSGLRISFGAFMVLKTSVIELEPAMVHRNLLEEAAREWAKLTLATEEAIETQMQDEHQRRTGGRDMRWFVKESHFLLNLGHVDVTVPPLMCGADV